MMRILEHFVPNTEFNLHTLKALAESLTSTSSNNSQASPTNDTVVVSVNGNSPGYLQPVGTPKDGPDIVVDEIEELHKELGWLRIDSNGVYSMWSPMEFYHTHNMKAQIVNNISRTCRRKLNISLPRRRAIFKTAPPQCFLSQE